jgi:hypothetical protein
MRYLPKLLIFAWILCLGLTARAANTNTLVWSTANDRVSADIHEEALWPLLKDIAHQTGWHIFVEPGSDRLTDVKFRNLPTGDALKKLLGDLNFALVPETNGPDLLYVFTTTMQAATRAVAVAAAKKKLGHVPNQLVVKLKPGADIDAIAKKLGAKVIKRDDKNHLYLLEFPDAATTDAALAELQGDSDVESVGYNTIFDPPGTPMAIANAPGGPPSLVPDAPTTPNPCDPVIGMVDTAYEPSGTSADKFVTKQLSVVDDANSGTQSSVPTHGTAMAQAMVAGFAQMSGKSGSSPVQIVSVNVYPSGDTTTSWYVAQGIEAAVANGATVINLSLGSGDDSAALDSVIQQYEAQGIVFFAAAGNTPVATPTYPAAVSGVNAVTALSGPDQLASYANYGNFVDMALPGTSYVYFNGQAYVAQGTSSATAYASAIAAETKTINCGGWPQIIANMAATYPKP